MPSKAMQDAKQAICRAMVGGQSMTLAQIARVSGISGSALTDAVHALEDIGTIGAGMAKGRPFYYLKTAGRAVCRPKKAAADQKTAINKTEVKRSILAMLEQRAPTPVSSRELNRRCGGPQTAAPILSELQRDGMIERAGWGMWQLVQPENKTKPEQEDTKMETTRQTPQQESPAVSPPVLEQPDAGEKTATECPVKVGAYSDGSFAIHHENGRGRLEMVFSREQMLYVIDFVQRFLKMEAGK